MSCNSGPFDKRSAIDSTELEKIEVEKANRKCILCGTPTVDELNLGALYIRNGVIVHYFCVLFCSNLRQRGGDDDGILGFLTDDIQKEARRVRQGPKHFKFYKCCFCKQPGATIGCCKKSCKLIYHFPCGLKNQTTFDFTSNFETFCKTHKKDLPMVRNLSTKSKCRICSNDLTGYSNSGNQRIIFGSCCHMSTFHKECIQKYALTSGYYFKCPTCAKKEDFINEVKMQGIFVPERDAEWEVDPTAYRSLRLKYSVCDAEPCRCPSGRDRLDKNKGSTWYLQICYNCAAAGTHIGCSPSPLTAYEKWVCESCSEVEERLKRSRRWQTVTYRGRIKKEEDSSSVIFISSSSSASSSSSSAFSPSSSAPSSSSSAPSSSSSAPSSSSSASSSSSGTLFSPVRHQNQLLTPPPSPPQSDQTLHHDSKLMVRNPCKSEASSSASYISSTTGSLSPGEVRCPSKKSTDQRKATKKSEVNTTQSSSSGLRRQFYH